MNISQIYSSLPNQNINQMKTFIIALTFLTLIQGAYSQAIKAAEYYLDKDPGVGNGIPITLVSGDSVTANFTLSSSSSTGGIHTLGIRVKDSLGNWSQHRDQLIYFYNSTTAHQTATSSIIKAEYFVNHDPGPGEATAINISPGDTVNGNFAINLNQPGVYSVGIRVKDANGNWSQFKDGLVYYYDTIINYNTAIQQITSAEYYFDHDPGIGNGIPISLTANDSTTTSFTVNCTGIFGLHSICVRVKDNAGNWSTIKDELVYLFQNNLSNPTPTSKIVAGEYYLDHDPGAGNGIQISFNQSDTLNTGFTINGNGLHGLHTLCVRVRDSLNNWSNFKNELVYFYDTVIQTNTNSNIVAAEYFIDGDPGAGKGTGVYVSPGDSITVNFSKVLTGLSAGYHKMNVRVKSSDDNWSLAVADTFFVQGCLQPTANFTISNVCFGDTVHCINTSTNVHPTLRSFKWDFNNDGSVEDTTVGNSAHLFTAPGYYMVKLKITNETYCMDSVVKMVQVYSPPPGDLLASGPTTICQGQGVTLYTNVLAGYVYVWYRNDTILTGQTGSSIIATQAGNYKVKITSAEGCTTISSPLAINVLPLPVVTIVSYGSAICLGDSVLLEVFPSSGVTYIWKNYGSTINGQTSNQYYAKNTGVYSVDVMDMNGCTASSSGMTLNLNSQPVANITALGQTAFCLGDSVKLSATVVSGYSYQWYEGTSIIAGATGSNIYASQPGSYKVDVTDGNGCSQFSSAITVSVFQIPTNDFTMNSLACDGDTVLVNYTGNATTSAIYNWNFDSATVISGSAQGPFHVRWNQSGLKTVTLKTIENGCSSAANSSTINVNTTYALVSSPNSPVCGGDSVYLFANTGTSLQYQWFFNNSEMQNETNAWISTTTAGNYSVFVYDTLSKCSKMSADFNLSFFSSNFGLAFSANNNLSTPPFNVSFQNQTPNMSSYSFLWDFGDGTVSNFYNPFHNYAYNGSYDVTLYAENVSTGCKDTLEIPNYINCSGGTPNPCTLVPIINQGVTDVICSGDSIKLSTNPDPSYQYKWAFNNVLIPGASDSIFYAKQNGSYRAVILYGQCTVISQAFILNHYPHIQPSIISQGTIVPCTDDSLKLSLTNYYSAYNWSTGQTGSSIYVSQTGYYNVTVTDNYGCNFVSPQFQVNASFLAPPPICIVGVDSASQKLRVIWEKPLTSMIDSFYIFRESTYAGVYDKIGTVAYSAPGIFIDTLADPNVRAYRYKLAALDTCGQATLLSDFHKSNHLTINAGLNGAWNLIWDGYAGFPFGSYLIYRGTTTSSLQLIAQLPSTLSSFTDLNPPSGTLHYMIEVINPMGCYPDSIFAKANTNYNTSRSNKANNNNIQPIYLTADFSASTVSGVWPVAVHFSDNSTGNPDSWLWDFGDGNTGIEQNPVHTYNNTGLYSIKLSACKSGICDTTIKTNYINVLPNGVVEVNKNLVASVYPNPNSGNFTIEIMSENQENFQLKILSVDGKEIHRETFKSHGASKRNIQLENISKGIYFVMVSGENQIMYKTKFIVQ